MQEKLLAEKLVSDLSVRGDFGHGALGKNMHYIITGIPHVYLIISDYSNPNLPKKVIASKEAYENLVNDRVSLSKALDSSAFTSYDDNGDPISKEESDKIVEDLKKDDPNKTDDENSVQIESEAKVQNDVDIIKEIQNIYRPDLKKLPENIAGWVVNKGPIVRPFSITMYGITSPISFVPIDTTIILANAIFSSTTKGGKYEEYKNFMYQNTQKSSKITAGLGVILLNQGGGGKAVAADLMTKAGEKVYDNGQPKKDSKGNFINFDFAWTKTWTRLSIKADIKRSFVDKGYDRKIFRIPEH